MVKIPDILLRGIRTVIPAGHVLGRLSSGSGQVELIPLSSLGSRLSSSGTVSGGGSGGTVAGDVTYLGLVIAGPVAAGKQFLCALSHRYVRYPSTLEVSVARAKTAPFGNITFYLVNDLAVFLASGAPTGALARIAFTIGNATGVVTWYNTTVTVPALTSLYVVFPASDFDPFLANIELLFAGDIVS